ncbi:hypothetical protein ACO0LG_03000 [Undibacterium sp. Ji42W]|uniref:hypothetical protein n=1 Tax=Undibacterium sp. Ji42W TaxID=3413039 RepID=UPI003BF0D22D
MANNNKEIHILISGASVAALSTAYWLTRYGFKLTVVERAPYCVLVARRLMYPDLHWKLPAAWGDWMPCKSTVPG